MSERVNLAELRRRIVEDIQAEGYPVGWDIDDDDAAPALLALANAVYALDALLDVAERVRGGDPSLDPEEWYASRDYARVALSKFDIERRERA